MRVHIEVEEFFDLKNSFFSTTKRKVRFLSRCLAAACLIPGTIANKIAQGIIPPEVCFSDIEVSIENPAGRLDATVVARLEGSKIEICSAAYRRSAQILMRGSVRLYRTSAELIGAMGG
ncbi:hypothetical protein [Pseudomonas silensiensis]|uniref:hypothetical protein n=1 Tax=Pseudomonas silensiensis TaxID=2991049 RepID=UPI003D2608DD